MDAVILAADHGMDLSPLTAQLPKHLLPIGNRPCLVYAIEAMRDAGFNRVAVTVNGGEPHYRRLLGDGSEFAVQVSFAPDAAPLGTDGCLRTTNSIASLVWWENETVTPTSTESKGTYWKRELVQ